MQRHLLLALLLLTMPASASLRRVVVTPRVAKDLGLTVTATRHVHYPDTPTVTVTAPDTGPWKTLFGCGLQVSDRDIAGRAKELFVDVPIDTRRPFQIKPGLDFTFRLHDSMIPSAVLYFRTGTPYSEVAYEVPLREYVVVRRK